MLDQLSDAAPTIAKGRLDAVAVIGIGCRFPGSIGNALDYWQFLLAGNCGIVEVPRDRWSIDKFYSGAADAIGRMRTRWGGFLASDVYGFDPGFFDMSPREATSMDPQQRLLLQVGYEAIQDSGLRVVDLQQARAGVFVGISTSDFGHTQQDGASDIFAGTGSAFSIAANRLSHRFNLNGPSLSIDTACSSALVAVDQAVRHLTLGTCDMALAGGVNCMLDPRPFIAFSSANMLSPTGTIYSFDSRANGFVRGEGCGLVLLKPLGKALSDGDRIYAVIRNSTVNQDGYTSTLTAPSGTAQQEMLEELVAGAGVDPLDVGYVEAHGTGTPVGDPIEATAIGRVFGSYRRTSPALVGSFKPNLGHLESASGIAGFIKSVLVARNGIAPANRNFEKPNPNIPFDALGIRVPCETTRIAADGKRAMTAVNSFGFGGTNASVLLEAPDGPGVTLRSRAVMQAEAATPGHPIVVPLSAGSKPALALWASRIADEMEPGGAFAEADVAGIASALRSRDELAERAAVVVEPDRPALQEVLRGIGKPTEQTQAGSKGPTVITGRAARRTRLAFAFSGQGGQWWAMSRRLLKEEPTYRKTVEMFDEAIRPLVGWSTVEEMLRDEASSRINDADITQASIFACQIGLYELWRQRGYEPELLIGHSFGEVAATYIAGSIDLDAVSRIIAARGDIPHHSTRRGAMATIGLTVEQLQPLLPEDGSVVIAAYNGPVAQTVSGMEPGVVTLLAAVAQQYPDALARRMTMNFGWHSEHLDDCEAWFRKTLGEVASKPPRLPIVSTVTGILETQFDVEYWWQNLRQPVSFTRAVDFCLAYGINAILELGPHRTLTPLFRGIAQEQSANIVAVNSLDRGADDFWTLARAEAGLFVAGAATRRRAQAFSAGATIKMPWANQRLVEMPAKAKRYLFEEARHPLLGFRTPGPEPIWTNELSLKNQRYIGDHRVTGECLFPAAGYIEIMGAALRDHFGVGPVELRDFRIHAGLALSDDDIVQLSTRLDPATGKLRIFSSHQGSEEGWRLRAEAYGWVHNLTIESAAAGPAVTPDSAAVARFYEKARGLGLEYGPAFRLLTGLEVDPGRSVRATIAAAPEAHAKGYFAFPGTLDSVLQSCIGLALADPQAADCEKGSRVVLPIGARKIFMAAPLSGALEVEARSSEEGAISFLARSMDGTPALSIEDLETRSLGGGKATGDAAGQVYEEHFEPVSADAPAPGATVRRWLVITDNSRQLAQVCEQLTASGAEIEVVEPRALLEMSTEATAQLVEGICNGAADAGILFSLSRSATLSEEESSGGDLGQVVVRLTGALVTLGKVLAGLQSGVQKPRIVVMTERARQLPEDPPITLSGVAQSALVGLTRTLQNELQDTKVVQVDTDRDGLRKPDALIAAMLEDSRELEHVVRGARRLVSRLVRYPLTEVRPQRRSLTKGDGNFAVTMSSPGVLDNIVLREARMPAIGDDEILVEIAAVGLNFRDVMAASAILPDELEGEAAYWRNLGLEFAGTVKRVGRRVRRWRAGDRVMGMGKGLLRRYVAAKAALVMRVPGHVDLVEAATMPVAYITAHYSLAYVGHLARGEKALVHLASGGVGLAAIQVARDLGAEVVGTAGSDEKRAFVRRLGVEHMFNSRGLDFAEQVNRLTGGRGVDLVLNSLSGPGIDKSLECLAPFGRMVEIGKRDLADDKPVGLKSLYYNNTYTVVDLSTLPMEKPQLFLRLLDEVGKKVASKAYKPLHCTRFPVSQAAEALRTLARARHIGKIVVELGEDSLDVEDDVDREMALSGKASYLVTGGLRGFGVAVADWLSQRGAGRLLLAGRSGTVDADAAATIAAIKARGTEVVPLALDVADGATVERQLAPYWADRKPLRGIVHGAAVIEDGFVTQLDRGKIERVVMPKVAGALNLHRAANRAGVTLDFLVSFSSVAQLLGSPGQANYTAANSVLNALAVFRRGHGMPGTSVAWGMISGSGFVARSEAMTNYLDSIGIKPIPDTDAARSLGRFLRAAGATPTYANLDWMVLARSYPGAAENPRLKSLTVQRAGGQSRIIADLASTPRSEWEGLLSKVIAEEVGRVLKIESSTLSVTRKLSELGLDSLSTFELKNRIEELVDVSIPVARFLQTPTIAGLAKLIATAYESRLKQLAARSTAGADAVQGGATAVGFRPLERQLDALLLPSRAMTSELALDDLQLAGGPKRTLLKSVAAVAERLAALAQQHDALRLNAVKGEDGALSIAIGSAPVVEEIAGDQSLGGVAVPGPLWRFGVRRAEGSGLVIEVRAHRAAADTSSVRSVIEWLAGADLPERQEAIPFSRHAAQLLPAEGSAQQLSDAAYWREVLHSAPQLIPLPARNRAAAPAGFGINRGPLGRHDVTIPIDDSAAVSEARLIADFAQAAGAWAGRDALVLERHVRDRVDGVGEVIGPCATSYPMVLSGLGGAEGVMLRLVEAQLAQVADHLSLDTPAIERLLGAELLARHVSLRQLGFGYVDNRAEGGAADYPVDQEWQPFPITANELQLLVIRRRGELALRLIVDTSVVDRPRAEALLEGLISRLSAAMKRKGRLVPSEKSRWSAMTTAKRAGGNTTSTRRDDAFPLTVRQQALLGAIASPVAHPSFNLYWMLARSLRITPQLDLVRLKRALDDLAWRHEATRMRFVVGDDGKPRAFLLPKPLPILTVEDAADEEAAQARALVLSSQAIDPFSESLFQVVLIRYQTGDIVVAKGHHAVMDGYSIGLLIEDMVQLYLGLTLAPVGLATRDYIQRIDLSHDPAAIARREAYLRELFREPVPRAPHLGSREGWRESGPTMTTPDGELTVLLDQGMREELGQRAATSGATVATLLMAALAHTLSARAQGGDAFITVAQAMRTHKELASYVNWVARNSLVRCSPGGATVEQTAHQISADLGRQVECASHEHILWHGPEYDRIRTLGSYTNRYMTGMLTADRWSRGGVSSPMQRMGGLSEIDLGFSKIKPLDGIFGDRGTLYDLRVQTFEGQSQLGIRCGYSKKVLDQSTATDVFAEVLDRLGLAHLKTTTFAI